MLVLTFPSVCSFQSLLQTNLGRALAALHCSAESKKGTMHSSSPHKGKVQKGKGGDPLGSLLLKKDTTLKCYICYSCTKRSSSCWQLPAPGQCLCSADMVACQKQLGVNEISAHRDLIKTDALPLYALSTAIFSLESVRKQN